MWNLENKRYDYQRYEIHAREVGCGRDPHKRAKTPKERIGARPLPVKQIGISYAQNNKVEGLEILLRVSHNGRDPWEATLQIM